MNNKTATYLGLAVLCAAPLGYYIYRDTLYGFIKGSFRSNLKPLGGDKKETLKESNPENLENHPEITHGKRDRL